MSDILKEFELRIAANKRELEEQEHALAVLKRTMGRSSLAPEATALAPKAEEANFDDLFNQKDLSKKRSLVDEIRDLVKQFGSKEFTVAIVEAALAKTGIEIDTKQPRARIAVAMGKLEKEGFLAVSFRGAGNTPNVYKINSGNELLA
jgi:hypothetical protein